MSEASMHLLREVCVTGEEAAYQGAPADPPFITIEDGKVKACGSQDASQALREEWLRGYHAGARRLNSIRQQIIAVEQVTKDLTHHSSMQFDKKAMVGTCQSLIEKIAYLKSMVLST